MELFLAMQGVDVSTMRCGHPDCMDAVYVVENANSSSLTRERERERGVQVIASGRLVCFGMQFGEKRDSI